MIKDYWYYGINKTPKNRFYIMRLRHPNTKQILGYSEKHGGSVWLEWELAKQIQKNGSDVEIQFFDSEEEASFVLKEIDHTATDIKKPPKRIRGLKNKK